MFFFVDQSKIIHPLIKYLILYNSKFKIMRLSKKKKIQNYEVEYITKSKTKITIKKKKKSN
jgi:hypothetical protein